MLYSDRTMTNLSANDLRRAASIKDKIESLQNELNKIPGHVAGNGPVPDSNAGIKKRGRRKMSASARARISAAAKKRWKKAKAAGKKTL